MAENENLPAPQSNQPHKNAASLSKQVLHLEFNWLSTIIEQRLSRPDDFFDINTLLGYPVLAQQHPYAKYAQQKDWQEGIERLALALGMASSMPGTAFKPFLQHINNAEMRMLFGGEFQPLQYRFIPTIQTLLFVWAGTNYDLQAEFMQSFTPTHGLFKEGVLETYTANQMQGMSATPPNWINLPFRVSDRYLSYFMGGPMPLPQDNQALALEVLKSDLTFDELILDDRTKKHLQPLINYAQYGQEFFKNKALSKNFKPGYIALLHGPPGTGKTLIASTIGKHLGLTTYQLDVSQVVSKYIGETSQNINRVMDELTRTIEWLEGKPCILFIDEADSFMGKRSEVKDSKDRYANLDVSNLLQKFEQFPGLVILASNYEQNFDEAFKRRFKSEVLIPPPEVEERTQLWKMYLPQHMKFPGSNFARTMAESFALTGAQIANIMSQAVMTANGENKSTLDYEQHLEATIKNELKSTKRQYKRPDDFMTKAQIDEQIYQQELLWIKALPTNWRYGPLSFPRLIAQVVTLEESDIKDMVKKVKRRWEGGRYSDIPWKDGIQVVMRDLCAARNLDWNAIQAKYDALEKAEGEKIKAEEAQKRAGKANNSGKTVQLVPPEKQAKIKGDAPEKTTQTASEKPKPTTPKTPPIAAPKPKILSYAKAEVAWRKALPEGYQFEKSITSQNLARTYALTQEQITLVMEKALLLAQKAGGRKLNDAVHFTFGIEQFCEEQGLDIKELYTESQLKKIRQAEAKEVARRKQMTNEKEAITYWGNIIPVNYRYESKGMPGLLGQYYGPFTFGEIDDIMAKAKSLADEQQATNIQLSMLEGIMQEMGIFRKRKW